MKILLIQTKTSTIALALLFCLLCFSGCGERRETHMEENHEEMYEDGQMMQDGIHENRMQDSIMHDSTMHDTTMQKRM